MDSFSKQKWEDLNLSRDELNRIGQALQKEEFRSLLLEYVKEINDPENRKQYEKEITQLENERGVDIKFVHPSSGYVIKTSLDGKSKAFINICSNTNVGKPSSTPDVEDGNRGLLWSLPYCLAPPREDVDKKNNACTVYDVVFHPDTIHQTKTNGAFKKLVNDTALKAVEDNFHVTLDKINIKFPKMQFKGIKHATVIRSKIENFQQSEFTDSLPNYPYPPVKEVIEPDMKRIQREFNDSGTFHTDDTSYITPNYTIKHLNTVDMQDYTNELMSKMFVTVPNELVIVIDLPLLKCYTDASLDIIENTLYLVSENPKYKLNLNLPYTVDSNRGNAKFDAVKKILTVTLAVIKQRSYKDVDLFAREDSGVESDNCNGRSNSVSSGDEDVVEKKTDVEESESTTDKCNRKNHRFSNTDQKFLKSDIHYALPNFSCQLLKNTLTFTLQVSNVDPESVQYCFLNNSAGYHLTFLSMGTGFFPVNYAFYLLLSQHQIKKDTLNVEVWDNNVIAQILLTQYDTSIQLSDCFIGTDENNVQRFIIPTSDTVGCGASSKKALNATNKSVEVEDSESGHSEECIVNGTKNKEEAVLKVSIEKKRTFCAQAESENFQPTESRFKENESKISPKEDRKPIEVSHTLPEEDKDLSVSESASSIDENTSSSHRQPAKSRTVSESQQGEIMQNKNRGILKIGRSLSESSVDDYVTWSSEKNSEIEKTKKTVRFSEVIYKQVFRMNSSILGQRKKNQRKTKNKKRAQERRLSESGGESEGENEAVSVKGKNSKEGKHMGVWLKEDEELSSCDVSEVSEASDISESDDGLREGSNFQMPCSKGKNHKRRGKKSARKNAATAKLQFIEN